MSEERRPCLCCGNLMERRMEPLPPERRAKALALICLRLGITPGELAARFYRDDLEFMAPGFAAWLDELLKQVPSLGDSRF